MDIDTKTLIDRGEEHIVHCYNRAPVVFDHGEGSYLFDLDGKKYLDFVAGISVNALGYNDPGLKDTIEEQAGKLMHVSNLYWTKPVIDAAEKITKATGMDKVFFGNSGTEAVEGAIKLARMFQKSNKGCDAVEIISMKDSFHGRTYAATTASGQDHFHENLEPLPEGFVYVPFNDIDALKEAISEKTAAILLEPVQGEGGILPADPSYLKEVRELCDTENIVLIFDEVQCGAGRTGKFLAAHNYGVMPDLVCMAKGIGGGFPIGALLMTDQLASALVPGTHGSTYGGNPLATAVCDYVLSITTTEAFLNGVEENGEYLIKKLRALKEKYPQFIKEVRGLGLIDGIAFSDQIAAADVVNRARDLGLLLVTAANNVIRLVPPLTVSKAEIDEAVQILDTLLSESE